MNLNLTVNEGCAEPAPPATPGVFSVRAYYLGLNDAGHLYGPFSTREAAERCCVTLACRENVRSAIIEEES